MEKLLQGEIQRGKRMKKGAKENQNLEGGKNASKNNKN